ncbi:MAG: HAD-IIA family hydrolase [Acidimicrobiia bacterium]
MEDATSPGVPEAWALDLDGVVWLADRAIDGSADAIARLRAAGHRVVFVTNFSWGRRADLGDKLARHGIDPADDVLTSSLAAAALIEPGESVLVVGGPGIVEAVESRGAEAVLVGEDHTATAPVDAVLVGMDPQFDYRRMTIASTAVRRGARLLATNDDSTYPTEHGPVPGGGAILASIATAAGVEAIVAGKPNAPIAALVRERCGAHGIMVGDRPDTDGRFARTLGWEFGLVLTGTITAADLPVVPAPDRIASSLADMVTEALSAAPGPR